MHRPAKILGIRVLGPDVTATTLGRRRPGNREVAAASACRKKRWLQVSAIQKIPIIVEIQKIWCY